MSRFTNDTITSTTLPTTTGAYTNAFWVRFNSAEYGGGEQIPVCMGTPDGAATHEGLILDANKISTTTVSAVAFRDNGADLAEQVILAGSDTKWLGGVWRHAAGSTSYRFSYLREGSAVLTTITFTLAAQATFPSGIVRLGGSQFAGEDAVDSDCVDFLCRAEDMSDAAVIAFLRARSAPAGTNLHYLPGSSGATAHVNSGTAGNWSTTAGTAGDTSGAPVGVTDIDFFDVGAAAYSTAGGSSVAPSYPTTALSGSSSDYYELLFVGMKPGTANTGSITDPSGWGSPLANLSAGGYGATLAGDSGNTNIWVYGRVSTGTVAGTETVTVNVNGATGVAWGQIVRFRSNNAGRSWSVAITSGSDGTAGAVSVTGTADPGVQAGDTLVVGMCIPTDANTANQRWSGQRITQTGVTFGGTTKCSELASNAGNDIGGTITSTAALSGTSSAAPVFASEAGTAGTTPSGTNYRGPALFVRLRTTAASSSGPGPTRTRTAAEHLAIEPVLRRAFSAASIADVPPPAVDNPPLRVLRILRDERISGDLPAGRRWVLPSSVDVPQFLLWAGFPDDVPPVERVQRARLVPILEIPPVGSGSAAFSAFAVAASGLVTFTGSGSAVASSFAVGAAGEETFNGSSSAALSPFAAGASGTEAFVGSGTAAAQAFATSSSGAETFTGAGTTAAQAFAASGNGAQGAFFSGTGSAAAAPFAVSAAGTAAAFTGTGSAAAQAFAAAGTGSETFAGAGTATASPFAANALGVLGNATTGAGAAALAPFGAVGAGGEAISGSGSGALSAFAVDGVAGETFVCSGSAALRSFAADAIGDTGPGGFVGFAACDVAAFGVSGVILERFLGSASVACSPFGAHGSEAFPFNSPPPASRIAYARARGKPRISRP